MRDGMPIAFGAGLESKAAIESADGLRASGIGVFADCGGDAALFSNERVYWSSGWTYDNIKYWTRAPHVFAAVHPYSTAGSVGSGTASFNRADGSLTISCTSGLNLGTRDLMYSQVSLPAGTYTNSSGYTVRFPMHHACAAVEFKVVNASAGTVTNVRNPRLSALRYKGTASVSAAGVLSWAVSPDVVSGSEYSQNEVTVATLPVSGNINDEATWRDVYSDGAVMVVPQEIYTRGVMFSFMFNDRNGTSKTYTFDLGDGKTVRNWVAGKRYTYIATITPDYIRLNVIVRDWIENEYDLT